MPHREYVSVLSPGSFDAVLPAPRTQAGSPFTGADADLKGYDSAFADFIIGAPGIAFDATNKIRLSAEEADDDGSGAGTGWSAVAALDLVWRQAGAELGQLASVDIDAGAKASRSYQAAYLGKKRHFRPVIQFLGTHGTGTSCAAKVFRAHKTELNR